VDVNNNSSETGPAFCIDNCPVFELPNVFTPNDDNTNDVFKAIKVRQLKEINLTVLDRWGNTVYKTNDPYFNWDGISIHTKQAVSAGTFFYICDVFEPRLKGIVKRTLKGTITVLR
jgi:gliding motility-associated-like protein